MSDRLTEQEQEVLVEKLRKKEANEQEKEQLIKSHIGLAKYLAKKASYRSPHLYDVFVADALYGLVKAVNDAEEALKDNNITPYISRKIYGILSRSLTEQQAVRTPYSTIKRREKEGKETKVVFSFSLSGVLTKNDTRSDEAPPKKDRHKKSILSVTHGSMYELRDLIKHSIRKEFEQQVVDLRIQGYTDKEIAEILDCNRTTITKARKVIEARFEELNK